MNEHNCKDWLTRNWPGGKLPVDQCMKCKKNYPVEDEEWLNPILKEHYLKFVAK